MIEIVYNKGKEKTAGNEEYFCIPKNIRQIGDVSKDIKIYMEDYVYTYLTSDWKLEETKGCIAVLLGTCDWKNSISYVFIKSAVVAESMEISKDYYPFTDKVWGGIYENTKKYFQGQEIVGWYLSLPDGGLKLTDAMIRTHTKHFSGNDKVLLLADPYECECCFYIYRNNRMEKQDGYYIFYEKNELMQEYILDKNPLSQEDFSGKAQDRAVEDFRKIIARKQEERKEKTTGISWGMVAGTGAIALVLAAGIFIYNSKYWVEDNESEKLTQETVVNMEDSVVEESVIQGSGDEDMVLLTPEASGNTDEMADKPVGENEDTSVKNKESTENEQKQVGDLEEKIKTDESNMDEEAAVSVYTKYTVRKGDTLSKISMRYYGDFSKVSEICKINNMLEDDIIRVGQTILLP